ncbi:5-formyltetrahydrofolate cyclo-ligase [Algoriphagus aestuarii]|nr:5-formyltetrahydrofolate cyclo-ligase [Algoriphagus aestuarii]
MSLDKNLLRKEYRLKRKALSEEEVQEFSTKIFLLFKDWLSEKPSILHVHVFLPIIHQKEVNTLLIRDYLFEKGAKVYTSVLGEERSQMETVLIEPSTSYTIDSWGIPVPLNVGAIDPGEIQLVLVPMLAFDLKGNRIGFGKGYYDQFLASLSPKVLKMGLSFFSPVQSILAENHDIPLDYCITTEKVFTF